MIAQQSIEQIKELDIADVLSLYMKLEKKGVNYKGCCPFHNEKTPSLSVKQSKGIFKCFGCGKGGNAISFVMEHERKTFIEALEDIAGKMNIALEYEANFDREAYVKKQEERKTVRQLLQEAHDQYREELFKPKNWKAFDYLNIVRGYNTDIIMSWGLGYAPKANFRFLSDQWSNRGLLPQATAAGLVNAKEDSRHFDVMIDRIIYPIRDEYGNLISFAGREVQESKKFPKFINGPETDLYKKFKVLFGLDRAITGIRRLGYAVQVEGYHDVITLHAGGADNAFAPSGTELTKEQALLVKKHTKRVVIIPDYDLKKDGSCPGLESAQRSMATYLEAGIAAEICMLPKPAKPGDKIDADSFFRHLLPHNANLVKEHIYDEEEFD